MYHTLTPPFSRPFSARPYFLHSQLRTEFEALGIDAVLEALAVNDDDDVLNGQIDIFFAQREDDIEDTKV